MDKIKDYVNVEEILGSFILITVEYGMNYYYDAFEKAD